MTTAFIVFIVIYSIILHEIAHGYVAKLCGDPTAEAMGRLTLNPIPHIDPFMTIALPLIMGLMSGWQFMFGGAKPVPVNWANLRRWPRDPILVGIAGIAVNFALGFSLAGLAQISFLNPVTRQALAGGAFANFLLALFNMLPVPPLDGSRAFRFLLPRAYRAGYDRLERYGMFIIFGLLYTGVFGILLWPPLKFLVKAANIGELLRKLRDC